MSLRVGDAAPDFELSGIDGLSGVEARYRLSDEIGRTIVLAFYPADHSPVCTAQLVSYTEGIEMLERAGMSVWALSPQDTTSHADFAAAHGGFAFPLLSDVDREVGRLYGIIGLLGLYRRTIVIVDAEGRVAHVHRSLGPGFRFEGVDDLIDAVG